MRGKVSHEAEVNVTAKEAWELYGTHKLLQLIEDEFKSLIDKVEVVEGDGGLGAVLKLVFVPGTPGLSSYKEKFTRIDNKKRIREAEVVEGGYLDLGFTLYRTRFEIEEKDSSSCIIKSTIEYEIKDEAAANVSFVTIQPLANIVEVAKNYFNKNKA